ncbi:MAG: NUDIX domain-containing protein [Acidobacteriota bacterium]
MIVPQSPPASPPRAIHVVGAALIDGPTCLAARRALGRQDAGCWEFPGGKIEPGESPAAALARELAEELDLRIAVGRWLGRGQHRRRPDAPTIVLDVYLAHLPSRQRPRLRDHDAVGWFAARDLPRLRWAAADIPIVARVTRHLTLKQIST